VPGAVSTWEEPSVSDVIIDFATNTPVYREQVTPVPVITNVFESLTGALASTSQSMSAMNQSSSLLTHSSPKPQKQSSPVKVKPQQQQSMQTASAVIKAVLAQPKLSEEKLREIEEADRKLAERLQAEMDKEYEEVRTTMPSPAEALAMLRNSKNKKKVVAQGASEDNPGLIKEMAEQGFVVKVAKNRKGKH
jgi:hypothetical protein